MKKIFILVMLCLMIISQVAAQSICVDGIEYSVNKDEGTATLVSGKDATGDVTVPSTIVADGVGYKLISIGNNAFSENKKIQNVMLPETIVTINHKAFYSSSLTSINLPKGLKTLGWATFQYCKNLKELTIPGSVEILETSICANCDSLERLVFEEGIEKIPSYIAEFDRKLAVVKIPSTVNEIGELAFRYTSITSLEIPNSVNKIGDAAFGYCRELVSVKLSENITEIPYKLFVHCDKLDSIFIPQSVTSICASAFCYCYKLRKVNLPDNLIELYGAFGDCYNLTSEVTIPQSLELIGSRAFAYLNIRHVVLPRKIKKIPDGAFEYTGRIESVELHDEIESIGDNAFYGTDVQEIVIPNSVKRIGNGAFMYTHLRKVTIPHSVTLIGEQAFFHIRELETVTIGVGLKRIGTEAFDMDFDEIKDVYCFANEVPVADKYSFSALTNSNTTLHVRESLLKDFKEAVGWNKFCKIEAIPEEDVERADNEYAIVGISTPSVKHSSGNDIIYDLSGRRTDGNHKGIIIKNGKKILNRSAK